MKKIIFVVMMAAILATAGLAMALDSAKDPGMGMGYGPHSGGPAGHGPWRVLNLTPEQVEKMKALRKTFFEQALPLRNELMSKKFELKALWLQTNPDEGKILAKEREVNALRVQLQEKATKNRLEMRKILTPEQQAQLTSLLGRHRMRHRYGGGREFGSCCCGHHHRHHHYNEGMGMGYGPRW